MTTRPDVSPDAVVAFDHHPDEFNLNQRTIKAELRQKCPVTWQPGAARHDPRLRVVVVIHRCAFAARTAWAIARRGVYQPVHAVVGSLAVLEWGSVSRWRRTT